MIGNWCQEYTKNLKKQWTSITYKPPYKSIIELNRVLKRRNKNVQKNVTEPKIVDSENILCPSSKPFISMDFNNIPKDDNTTIINSSTLTGENYIVNL